MLTDELVVRASQSFVRLIIRRPHAYWFKQRFPNTPIPGLVFMSPDGEVQETFPLLVPGQTLQKLRSVIGGHGDGNVDSSGGHAKVSRAIERVTLRVAGMKKTASGAT